MLELYWDGVLSQRSSMDHPLSAPSKYIHKCSLHPKILQYFTISNRGGGDVGFGDGYVEIWHGQ